MSRIGKLPIELPKGAEVKVNGQSVEAKGPKGSLAITVSELLTPKMDDGALIVTPRDDILSEAQALMKAVEAKGKKKLTLAEALPAAARTQWGTARARLSNMVHGVTEGFSKTLELVGVGYRAQMQGNNLKLALGLSHDVVYEPPAGITIACAKPTEITVTGIDKQVVGQVCAEIRKWRPPEPYKGKGIRYQGEYVRQKEGKKK